MKDNMADDINITVQTGPTMDNTDSHRADTEQESSVNKNQKLTEHVVPLVDTVLSFVMHGLNSGTSANVLNVASSISTVLEVRQSVKKTV